MIIPDYTAPWVIPRDTVEVKEILGSLFIWVGRERLGAVLLFTMLAIGIHIKKWIAIIREQLWLC